MVTPRSDAQIKQGSTEPSEGSEMTNADNAVAQRSARCARNALLLANLAFWLVLIGIVYWLA